MRRPPTIVLLSSFATALLPGCSDTAAETYTPGWSAEMYDNTNCHYAPELYCADESASNFDFEKGACQPLPFRQFSSSHLL